MSSPRKFRVWDGEEMHGPEALFVLDSRGNVWPYGVEHGSPTRDDLVPLFYTGLTDSEGTEIYEGDVVSYGVGRGLVRWHKDRVGFTVLTIEGEPPRDGAWYLGEVIGNRYENPELLEQEPA